MRVLGIEDMEEPVSSNTSESKVKKKKSRKRVKAIHTKIKEQMEFYFSDSNLHKDRFLKKAIEASVDGYIELEIFLKFNRIKALTDEVKVIADAVSYKSDLLQVNEDRTKVKRIRPLPELKNVDERTVYVEHLPMTANHEWVKRLFSACGRVSYVSLPKFQTTGDLKGFGFVEFETEDGAKMACEELNNPPVDVGSRVGMFPKSSKPLDAIKKKLSEDQILETEQKVNELMECENIADINELTETPTKDTEKNDTSTSEIDSGILVKRVKRRRTKSEGSVDDSVSGNDSSPQKRKKLEVSFDIPEDTDKSVQGGRKKSRKRKNRSKTVDVASASAESDKTGSEKKDLDQVQKSDRTDEDKMEKRRKVDPEITKEKTESENVLEKKKKVDSDKTEKETENLSSKKRKPDKSEDSTDGDDKNQKKRKKDRTPSKESSVVGEVEKEEAEEQRKVQTTKVAEVNGGTKKKKRRQRKKQHKQKEVPELRVIPKTEWLCLREEYLRLQKTSMAMLKKTLSEIKDQNRTDENKDDEKMKDKKIDFVPNVIVKVTADKPLNRRNLKSDLGDGIAIAYIDVKDGLCDGHIRCMDAHSAKLIVSQNMDGFGFTLVSGEEEKQYWDKLTSDREKKLNTKSRSRKRGHEKWMDKAQKASIENVSRQHITFDDADD